MYSVVPIRVRARNADYDLRYVQIRSKRPKRVGTRG